MSEFQIPPGWAKDRSIVGYLQAISKKVAAVADLNQTISTPPPPDPSGDAGNFRQDR